MDNRMITEPLIQLSLISDLKEQAVAKSAKAFVAAKTTIGDGLGGFYMWDESSVLTEDMTFLNVIASSTTSIGRWIRLFQRARTIPQGYLVQNGSVKKVFIDAITDSNGRATVNLTTDNTPTGPAIFTEIWDNRSFATDPQTVLTEVVSSAVYANAAGLLTTTHQFFRPNPQTLLGLLSVTPTRIAAAGTKVRFVVEGI